MISFRVLRDYPLVVVVGASRAVVLAQYEQRRNAYLLWVGLATAMILLFAVLVSAQVAQQARINRSLREGEELFRSLFVRSNAVMLLIEPDGGAIEDANDAACRFYGYSHERICRMTIQDINQLPPGEVAAERRKAKEESRNYFIFPHRLADGRVRTVEVHSTPATRGGRNLLFSIVHDITERKAAEDELMRLNSELERRVALRTAEIEDANREMESFSYSVAHDLRAPLRALDGFSTILLDSNQSALDEASVNYLKRIQTSARHMGQLIDDLLDLARISRREFERQDFDLGALARRVADSLSNAQPKRRANVAVRPRMQANGDPNLVRIVLNNLIGNAWKFTARAADASIEVDCVESDGQTIYFVRDNGVGFDMRFVGKLFDPFQRLHGRQEFEGTGIGLSIVQRIIKRHGGRVWAESTEGEGATFYFTLS
jgi:PAS domain S-box-containing protein